MPYMRSVIYSPIFLFMLSSCGHSNKTVDRPKDLPNYEAPTSEKEMQQRPNEVEFRKVINVGNS